MAKRRRTSRSIPATPTVQAPAPRRRNVIVLSAVTTLVVVLSLLATVVVSRIGDVGAAPGWVRRTAPDDSWYIGLNCPNVFADSDLVMVQTKIGSTVRTLGTVRVASILHRRLVVGPIHLSDLQPVRDPHATRGLLRVNDRGLFGTSESKTGSSFDALEVRLVLTKGQMAENVQARLVRVDDHR